MTLGKTIYLSTAIFLALAGMGHLLAGQQHRTILDIQPFSMSYKIGRSGTFIKVNKNFEKWYLLKVRKSGHSNFRFFHLENPYPKDVRVDVTKSGKQLLISDGKFSEKCEVLTPSGLNMLEKAAISRRPYAPICRGRLYLRNKSVGKFSRREAAVDFMRNNVWRGESIITALKKTFYKDAERITTAIVEGRKPNVRYLPTNDEAPLPALLSSKHQKSRSITGDLGISINSEDDGTVYLGRWYRSKHHNSIFVSLISPSALTKTTLSSFPSRVGTLDGTEFRSLVYLVAFDLSDLEVGFALGTEHPKVSYSERTHTKMKIAGWGGPDGIISKAPLISTGMISPIDGLRVIASFTGGFKRKHSVFRAGWRSKSRGGSHYGFVENGVIFSRLHPGLATAYIDKEGFFGMKTWETSDNINFNSIISARQNGLSLVFKNSLGRTVPGLLVNNNFEGNWSGDLRNNIRTLRSGICIQKNRNGRRFLIFGYFSSHTPNAMARVFQAYECEYAFHLDMNLLEHAYLATYHKSLGGEMLTQHLLEKMHWKDRKINERNIPRFIAMPDNRDFFYLLEKTQPDSSK